MNFKDKKKVTLSDCLEEIREIRKRCDEFESKMSSVCNEYWAKRRALKNKEGTTRWRAEKGEIYYCIGDEGEIYIPCEDFCNYNTNRYEIGNYFKTGEEAEKVVEKMKIYTRLKDLALRLNDGEEIDWKNYKQAKYDIYYDHESEDLGYYNAWSYEKIGQIYCLDENFLDIAKLEIGKENLIKLFA